MRGRAVKRVKPDGALHIGLFAPDLPQSGSANGIVTYVRILQAALRDLGHRVSVVSPRAIEQADGRIVPIAPDRSILTRLTGRFGLADHATARAGTVLAQHIRAVHRADPFDVFEMEESFGWVGGLGLDVPVVARLHGPHFLVKDADEPVEEERRSARRIVAEGDAIASVNGITCPSARVLHETLERYAIVGHPAAAIPNPIPLVPSADCWSMERCDPDQILFVGRFDLCKGADIALQAFAIAAVGNPRLRLVLCGPDRGMRSADGTTTHFAAYLREHIAPQLHPRIRYVGAVPPADIARLRRESALCLSTSRFETFGYVMAEALAMGMPLLASDTFGMSELLRHGETGYIAPVGDARAVAATLAAALADRVALAAVAVAGRARCAAILDPAKCAAQIVDFYKILG